MACGLLTLPKDVLQLVMDQLPCWSQLAWHSCCRTTRDLRCDALVLHALATGTRVDELVPRLKAMSPRVSEWAYGRIEHLASAANPAVLSTLYSLWNREQREDAVARLLREGFALLPGLPPPRASLEKNHAALNVLAGNFGLALHVMQKVDSVNLTASVLRIATTGARNGQLVRAMHDGGMLTRAVLAKEEHWRLDWLVGLSPRENMRLALLLGRLDDEDTFSHAMLQIGREARNPLAAPPISAVEMLVSLARGDPTRVLHQTLESGSVPLVAVVEASRMLEVEDALLSMLLAGGLMPRDANMSLPHSTLPAVPAMANPEEFVHAASMLSKERWVPFAAFTARIAMLHHGTREMPEPEVVLQGLNLTRRQRAPESIAYAILRSVGCSMAIPKGWKVIPGSAPCCRGDSVGMSSSGWYFSFASGDLRDVALIVMGRLLFPRKGQKSPPVTGHLCISAISPAEAASMLGAETRDKAKHMTRGVLSGGMQGTYETALAQRAMLFHGLRETWWGTDW